MGSLGSELVDGEDGGFGIRLAATVQPSKRKATACAIFAQLPAYRTLILEGGSAAPRGGLRRSLTGVLFLNKA